MKKLFLLIFILAISKAGAQNSCEANYSFTIPSGTCVRNTASFSVASTGGENITVFWNFGDDSGLKVGSSVNHSFESEGPHTITIIIQRNFLDFCIVERGLMVTPCLIIDFPDPVDTIPPGNPFFSGEEGNWRVKRSWVFQVPRSQTRQGDNDNLNLRTDGTFTSFEPFWNPAIAPGDTWSIQNEDRWTFKVQVNHYNPLGTFELETVDPLNQFSAAIYGYNHTLPVGVAMNSRYREIGFDSFEDYDYGKCANNHFSFRTVPDILPKITDTVSHSGRRSLRVEPDKTVTLKKEFVECEEEPVPVVVK